MKVFNTTAVCVPSKNYMVDLSERVKAIKKLVDDEKYFTINRARQYGKTTTLTALDRYISAQYDVIFLDFQEMSEAVFSSENEFARCLAQAVLDAGETMELPIPEEIDAQLKALSESEKTLVLGDIFRILDKWCALNERPLVLIIDEVDSATNNQVFLDFLARLRVNYIKRQRNPRFKTFQSVILAGVTDVRYLKAKIRDDEQHKVNSPWNIAADFNIDMSLSEEGIRGMLDEYEADHRTGMDTAAIAKQIREYTNGYPYLVSRICQLIDEQLMPEGPQTPGEAGVEGERTVPALQSSGEAVATDDKTSSVFQTPGEAWTEYGVDEAVKRLLSETGNAVFDSLTGKLVNYPQLKEKLRRLLLRGETIAWSPYDEEQRQLFMYGFIRNNHNTVAIANRVFEMLLYVYFIGENDQNNALKQKASEMKSAFIEEDGWLNVPKIMEHFITEHNRLHGENTEKFLEEEGRERFITYVSAIINGTGTYDIEPQTRTHKRMDLVIHYLGKRYIVELKIWHGDRYNEKGEQQISEYLDYFGLSTGYMLSFNFNKKKEPGVKQVRIGDKLLYEGTV